MVIGVVLVEQCSGFVGIDDVFVSVVCFCCQFWLGEGVGYIVQCCGGVFYYMVVYIGFIVVWIGDGGENDVDIVGQCGIVL